MNIKNILQRAEALYQQSNFVESIELCQKLIAKKPKLVQPRQILAVNYLGLNQLEQAVNEFELALELSPNDAHLLCNLGHLYLTRLNFEQAVPYLKRAIVQDHKLAAAYGNLAICQQELGDLKAAEENYRKAILRDGKSAEYHMNLGSLHMELGNFELALNMLMKALELDPSFGEVYFRLFSVMLYMHRYQDALEVADIGLVSKQLSNIQMCELFVGKATLFWLFDNVEEAQQAVQLSEGIYTDNSNYSNIRNLTVFHIYLKQLVNFRLAHPDFYQHETEQQIYFVSESHGFAPSGARVTYKQQEYAIKSLFVRGTKVFHLTSEKSNKFKESLRRLLLGLAPQSKIVLGFGEIDCRNNEGIFQHVRKSDANYQEVIELMVGSYLTFLQTENHSVNHRLFIYGVPAPHPDAVKQLDEQEQQLFINVIGYFNSSLARACQKYEMTFLDVHGLTSDNGVSNMQYHIDGFHLKPSTIIELFAEL